MSSYSDVSMNMLFPHFRPEFWEIKISSLRFDSRKREVKIETFYFFNSYTVIFLTFEICNNLEIEKILGPQSRRK